MKRLLIAVPVLLVTSALAIVGLAEWRLHRTYDEALSPLAVAVSADKAAEGARLGRAFGCSGCHLLAGQVLFEEPGIGRLIAPNLTRVVAKYSDSELVRLIRRGVKHNGTSVIGMPSEALSHIADDDLAAIISWLRAQPAAADATNGETYWSAFGLIGLALNKVPLGAEAPHDPTPPAARTRDGSIAEGRYLVSVTCRACHALHETTDNGFGMVTPPLADMARAYSSEEFRMLLTMGKAIGDREVGLMSSTARSDLSAITEAERAAIHDYLLSDVSDADP